MTVGEEIPDKSHFMGCSTMSTGKVLYTSFLSNHWDAVRLQAFLHITTANDQQA